MEPQLGVRFVGLYASFPVELKERRVRVLEQLLDLEQPFTFRRMKFGRLRGKDKEVRFAEDALRQVLGSIRSGEVDHLDLKPYNDGLNWVKSYQDSVSIEWWSPYYEVTDRQLSPVEERFGFAGIIKILYPVSRFSVDKVSSFQLDLLSLMKKIFIEQDLNYAFIHQGYRPTAPSSVGTDDVFSDTRRNLPLTSFDSDLFAAGRYFREYGKGAFWANFLGPHHVEKLGGLRKILEVKPSSVIDDLGSGRVLLQVGPSPLLSNTTLAIEHYQQLRSFLKPILLETNDDLSRVHKDALGSWKPPWSQAEAERKWKEDLAGLRKQYPE